MAAKVRLGGLMSASPVIIITGASSGIGEAAVKAFAQAGYRIVAAARRMERLQALAEEFSIEQNQILPVQTDVGEIGDIDNMVSAALDSFGQIDILFNNAGIGRFGWLESIPIEDIEAQIRVNLLGLIYTSRAVLPHMIERREGIIINMASIASFVATPTYTLYAASKHAVRGFTEALRREVSIYGIRVCGIYPGPVVTEFADHAGAVRKTGLTTPSALRLNSEEVAAAVLGLARRPRRMLIVPWHMYAAIWMNTLFPGLLDWLVERRFVGKERSL
jgi:short-subunit dehydrogenase